MTDTQAIYTQLLKDPKASPKAMAEELGITHKRLYYLIGMDGFTLPQLRRKAKAGAPLDQRKATAYEIPKELTQPIRSYRHLTTIYPNGVNSC